MGRKGRRIKKAEKRAQRKREQLTRHPWLATKGPDIAERKKKRIAHFAEYRA